MGENTKKQTKRKTQANNLGERTTPLPPKAQPTGITLLDKVIGGGVRWGDIINVVGDKSSGKTYLILEIIAYMQQELGDKLKFFYDDAEGGFSFDTEAMYGLKFIGDDQKPSSTVEEFGARFSRSLQDLGDDEYFVYVVDSLDGLSSEAERERDKKRQRSIEKGEVFDEGTFAMEKQKYMSEFFRLRASELHGKNALLVIISQVRDNIGVMFGEKHRRNGGKALDFYSKVILWLAEAEKHYKKGRPVGVTIKAQTKKAKTAQPFRVCYLKLLFDYGIDNVVSNIWFLYGLMTEKGKVSTKKLSLDWDGATFESVDSLVQYVEENSHENSLASGVGAKWDAIEESISSKGRKQKWKR